MTDDVKPYCATFWHEGAREQPYPKPCVHCGTMLIGEIVLTTQMTCHMPLATRTISDLKA